MMMLRRVTIMQGLAVLCLASGIGACGHRTPEGQVVAVVDGKEVTRRDLVAEPQASDLPSGPQAPAALAAILSGVIDRKLAAAEAERLKLDRTPDFVAQSRRLQEVLLSRTLFDRWAAEMPRPGAREIAAYVAANPQRFDRRQLFLIDRIEADAEAVSASDLTPLRTNDAVAALLGTRAKPFRREEIVVDSANLPLALYRQIAAAPLGYPLAVKQGGSLVVLAVTQARDAPTSPQQKPEVAVKALRQAAVEDKLADLRSRAQIAYQPGYRPQADGGPKP